MSSRGPMYVAGSPSPCILSPASNDTHARHAQLHPPGSLRHADGDLLQVPSRLNPSAPSFSPIPTPLFVPANPSAGASHPSGVPATTASSGTSTGVEARVSVHTDTTVTTVGASTSHPRVDTGGPRVPVPNIVPFPPASSADGGRRFLTANSSATNLRKSLHMSIGGSAFASFPGPRPNTNMAFDVFTTDDSPSADAILKLPAWAALMEGYPETHSTRPFVESLLGGIRHGLRLGYNGPLWIVGVLVTHALSSCEHGDRDRRRDVVRARRILDRSELYE